MPRLLGHQTVHCHRICCRCPQLRTLIFTRIQRHYHYAAADAAARRRRVRPGCSRESRAEASDAFRTKRLVRRHVASAG
jgi:hypothetical protein